MKSKNRLSKLIAFLVLLTVIAMIFVANTYSKYATNASGSDSVVVAKWSFAVNDQEIAVAGDAKTIEFGLFDTIYDSDGENKETDVAEGFIAPGTSGAFEFALKNTSEVTAQYAINLTVDNTDIPLEFSFDGETWTNDLTNLVAQDNLAIGASKNVKVQWRWTFGADTVTDVALGGQTVNVSATVVAVQAGESDIIVSSKPVFPTVTEDFNSTAIANGTSFNYPYAPFVYRNLDLYSGKTITKIGIPVKSVASIEENPTFTLYTVKKDALANNTATTATNTYEIEVPVSQYESTTINDWVYVDLTKYNINVAEDETLAFCAQTDKMTLSFSTGSLISEDYKFICKVLTTYTPAQENENLLMDVYYKEIEIETKPEESAKQVFPGIQELFNEDRIAAGNLVSPTGAPYEYLDLDVFSGKTITKIGIPVQSVAALDENQTFTVSTVEKDKLEAKQTTTVKKSYEFKLPLSQLGNSTTVNKWVYVDVNIPVAENETLAFGATTDTVSWSYSLTVLDSQYTFGRFVGQYKEFTNENIFFDIYYIDNVIENEKTQLEIALNGKNFSILGDSISTFAGYSNDATNTNDTIGSNAVYYTGSNIITNVNDTWWMQTANETGMNLLVNNSWSGDQVSNRGMNRAKQLHDNTGDNNGTNPDIIAVYLGINDIKDGVTLDNFTTNYNTMVSNIKDTYPDADVFLFTHIPYYYSSASLKEITDDALEEFNDAIRNIAKEKECHIVDLFNDSGINSTNFKDYMGDMGLHPNTIGMDAITNTFINALNNQYLNN